MRAVDLGYFKTDGLMVLQLLTRAQVTLFLIKINKKGFNASIIWLLVILEMLHLSQDRNVLLGTLTDNRMESQDFGFRSLAIFHSSKR